MARRVVTILGSARSDGHTARLLDAVVAGRPAQRFDLGALHIEDYVYGRRASDDFRAVAEAMVEAEAVLFATPVYWYAMSGVLKRFMDRMTDLITLDKPLGRRLAGRTVWVVANGADPALPVGFEVPFQRTASYFDMPYGGSLYVPMREGEAFTPEQSQCADTFGARVFARAEGPGSSRSVG